MIRRLALLASLAALLAMPAAAQADFGLVPESTTTTAQNRDGTIDLQAGSHPFSYTLHFELNTEAGGATEGGTLRDILIEAPPGLIGNPEAVPACPQALFEGGKPKCKPGTQVGVLRAILPGFGEAVGPLYNLQAPPGSAAQFGFSGGGGLITLPLASVRGEATPLNPEPFGVNLFSSDVPVEVASATATIWGVPADEGHTPERGPETSTGGVKPEGEPLPFLTLPTQCQASPKLTVRIDSKENPGVFVADSAFVREKAGNVVPLSGCEAVPFSPQIAAGPSSGPVAAQAAGLGFQLSQPNQGLENPKDSAVSETQAKRTELILPLGMTSNPAAAGGLGACSEAQFKASACPANSKLGSLTVHTPLLKEAVEGSIYLATPHQNPFGSLVAVYIIATAPVRGVTVKVAGKVEIDPNTGQLTTIVDGLPPVPYSSFEVRLREGPRAPLISPRTCGTYTTVMRLYPYSDPGTVRTRTAPFTITTGAAGGPCAATEAQLPNKPTMEAGTTAPLAGAFSPFVFKLSREEGDQRLSAIVATMPEGLSARLVGVPYCPEAQIAAAIARSHEGEGALEAASPSCPAASEVASVNAGAGAGTQPYYVQGKAYLAGPYKGAPLSLAIITPAIAGPFDLGTIVVRSALYINESTGQVTIKSDPLPSALAGIPLDVRKIAVDVDRSQFTLNPTSCEPLAVSGTLTTTTGATAPLQNRFQVGACKNLPFKPRLQIQLKGSTKRTSNPKLIATLTPRAGDANVSFAQVTLPKAAFLDNSHIGTICTRVQFAAGEGNGATCPPASVYGKAEATTPLLDYPLQGKVFLRASDNPLPDLVVAFKGPDTQPIAFALAGKTDSVKGALRNTFQSAPDVPVSKFKLELFGGKRGLVELSSGLCRHRAATVRFRAHNGREYRAHPKVKASCGKTRSRGRR